MISSMTGFGRASCQVGDQLITAEIKSVNHRFLDLTVSLPNGFVQLEEKVKRHLQSQLKRGKVTLYVSLVGDSLHRQVQVDWALLDQYLETMKQMSERTGIVFERSLELRDFLTLPDLFKTIEHEGCSARLEEGLLETINQALSELIAMRQKEGEHLKNDVLDRLGFLERQTHSLEQQAPKVVHAYQTRLEQRINDWLQGRVELDEARVINEVAIFAEKVDIAEEITRLFGHINHFQSILAQEGAIGRQLDFLIQEMNREINTMGSKSPDMEMTQVVVQMKAELEKIREQVQNVE
jgi:uncharacterized protein (TIGR00255 family)